MQRESVTVAIVTFNSRRYIARCLAAVLRQRYRPSEIIVVDNASLDGTRLVLERFSRQVRLFCNDRNIGFAAAQNQAIRASRSDWVLTLNPDVLLMPHFIERLVEASRVDSSIGVTCGKLLRADPDLLPAGRVIDSAGMYFTPSMRHFDRGWNQPDDGRYSNTEYVFGASAAAALYRREMIDDISLEDGFFDPDFFVYREDADVAWRAQLLGWRCLYAPLATALHVRTMRPDSRRRVAPVLRMHSVKNRFLMRVKNATADLYGRFWLPATARDFLVLSGCLLCEQGSLPALWHAATSFRRAVAKRRWIMGRRRAGDEYMAAWFDSGPAGWPVDGDVRGPERQLARAATP